MKKLIPVIGLCMLPFLSQARHTEMRGDYLGLVGELNYIKESSEACALSILNDPQASPSLKSRTIDAYNDVRQVDAQLIQQIATDARSRKSLCNYHKMDKMLTCHSIEKVKRDYRDPYHHYCNAKLEAYVHNLVMLEKAHGKLMKLRHEIGTDADSWSGMAGKDGKSCRTHAHSKVDYVCSALEQNELCSVTSLMQKVEKKQEQTMILKTEPGTDIRIVRYQAGTRKHAYHKHARGKKCTCK